MKREIGMTREDLYGAAFRYKKTGLWRKLWDTEMFALKLSEGGGTCRSTGRCKKTRDQFLSL